jgi:UDP-N-acetylglucosamine 2-epimerase (non-hydrolysing)
MSQNNKKKIFFIGGARPNFMKIAALLKAVAKEPRLEPILIHTGQHYDEAMSQSFFRDLEIPEPDFFLEVGSGSHAEQTALVMTRFEKICLAEHPALVVVVGDVNSTLAAALTAKKLDISVAHVEAGLRSFDLKMPEEINRMVTDCISDYLFVTEKSGVLNLKREGRKDPNIFFVGNTMIDTLIFGLKKLQKKDFLSVRNRKLLKTFSSFGVLTLHRPSNVDDLDQFKRLMEILDTVARKIPLIFPVHPRTRKNLEHAGFKFGKGIYPLEPLGYLEFLSIFRQAAFVLTDSGGLQEETTYLKIPCLTLRESTERPVTVEMGTNILVGRNIGNIPRILDKILAGKNKEGEIPPRWDGLAAIRIAKVIAERVA